MRLSLLRLSTAIALSPALLVAQEAEGSGTRTFMKPDTGLMVWTLVIFVLLMFVLSRYAFGPITAAVRACSSRPCRIFSAVARPSAMIFWASPRAASILAA